MTRVKQFADDLGISKNQAKNLINKGRSRKDGGSQILENVMKPKGYQDGGSKTNPKAPVANVKVERLSPLVRFSKEQKQEIIKKAEKQYRERNNPKKTNKKLLKRSGQKSFEKKIKDLQDFENTKSDITASLDRDFSRTVAKQNEDAKKNVKKRAGGGLQEIPADNKGLRALGKKAPGVVKEMGFKMRGGGIAIQGLGFTGVK